MNQQNIHVKEKARRLKDQRLRKIRYELRTLLFLEYEKRRKEFYKKLGDIKRDSSLSYDQKREKERDLRKENERLMLNYHRHPIGCWFCGNRKDDLIQDLDSLFWFCLDHFQFNKSE